MKFLFSLLLSILFYGISLSQSPDRWFNLDYTKDGVAGTGADRAINELLANRKANDVIVAVIDGGTDNMHEDLKNNMWVNPKEIPGNNIDDDQNGYVDDMNGWDFIGNTVGSVNYDNLELTRIYRDLNKIYGSTDPKSIPADKKKEYEKFLEIRTIFLKKYIAAKDHYETYSNIQKSIDALKREIGKDKLTNEDVLNFKTDNAKAQLALNILKNIALGGGNVAEIDAELKEAVDHYEAEYKYQLNIDYDPRPILVGDNYADASQRNYGNNDVKGPEADHGTHVAGIIGAIRGNNIGMDGISNHVKIMVVRCVPNGDERDKDVANAIRYAVDNGAKVINMSFGKYYGTNKAAVDDAVKYAMSKDVLIVHAAGNDGYDLKGKEHFPTRTYADKSGVASGWIEVGACERNTQPASFSCYGKDQVDLFAPGTEIYSTTPDNQYRSMQGTSMASPVVAGCAALIRAYFPEMTAPQVRELLMKTVTKVPGKVNRPADDDKAAEADAKNKTYKPGKVKYSKLCKSAGIVNVYNAVNEALKTTAAK